MANEGAAVTDGASLFCVLTSESFGVAPNVNVDGGNVVAVFDAVDFAAAPNVNAG